jgi:hypothetical protein
MYSRRILCWPRRACREPAPPHDASSRRLTVAQIGAMRALHLHTPMGTGRLPAGVRARTRRKVASSRDEYSCTRHSGRSRACRAQPAHDRGANRARGRPGWTWPQSSESGAYLPPASRGQGLPRAMSRARVLSTMRVALRPSILPGLYVQPSPAFSAYGRIRPCSIASTSTTRCCRLHLCPLVIVQHLF